MHLVVGRFAPPPLVVWRPGARFGHFLEETTNINIHHLLLLAQWGWSEPHPPHPLWWEGWMLYLSTSLGGNIKHNIHHVRLLVPGGRSPPSSPCGVDVGCQVWVFPRENNEHQYTPSSSIGPMGLVGTHPPHPLWWEGWMLYLGTCLGKTLK